MIRSGKLDTRIVIEAPTVNEDETGAENETWLPEAECWARVIETPGREFLKGDFRAEERTVFQIRWREIDSTRRVIWAGRNWQIDSVTGTFREGELWLHCRAQDGAN